VTTNQRAAAPVIWGFLIVSLLLGLGAVWLAPPQSRGSLLALGILATLACFALTAFVVNRTARLPRGPIHPLQRSSSWQLLSRSQWLLLTLGVTLIAAMTSVGTGLRIAAATSASTPPVAAPTVTPTAAPPPTTAAPTPTPTEQSTPASDGPSESASDVAGPSGAPGGVRYLDALDAVNGYYNAGPINLSGKRYPRSVSFWCSRPTSSYIEWNVAGSREFNATLGVADDTSNAFGRVVEMIFYDQDGRQIGKPTDVSVGHPVPITLPLTGVVHLRMACSGRDAKTSDQVEVRAAMGDAKIVSG
jgi:hypothetical protein